VGRRSQLEALESLLEQASVGRGGAALLYGDAGIGKSRLIAEASAGASARGFRVLTGQAFERDEALPFAPLVDLLRSEAARSSPLDLLAAWGPHAGELVKLLPELAAHGARPSPPLQPEAEKRRAFEALAAWLAGLAAERPVLVVLEDLHWADEATLEWLHHAARRAPAQPLAVLASYRREEAGEPLGRLEEALRRQRLALEEGEGRIAGAEVDLTARNRRPA